MPSSLKFYSEASARKLADNIINFWVAQGYPREVLKVTTDKEAMDSVVRSNLRNGTPPGKPVAAPRKSAG